MIRSLKNILFEHWVIVYLIVFYSVLWTSSANSFMDELLIGLVLTIVAVIAIWLVSDALFKRYLNTTILKSDGAYLEMVTAAVTDLSVAEIDGYTFIPPIEKRREIRHNKICGMGLSRELLQAA